MIHAEFLKDFVSKRLDSLKFQIFQIMRLLTLVIHSKNHSNAFKITLVLQIYRAKVWMLALPLEILVLVKLLNLSKP